MHFVIIRITGAWMIVLVKEESPQINDTLNIIINEDEIATGKVEAILE